MSISWLFIKQNCTDCVTETEHFARFVEENAQQISLSLRCVLMRKMRNKVCFSERYSIL